MGQKMYIQSQIIAEKCEFCKIVNSTTGQPKYCNDQIVLSFPVFVLHTESLLRRAKTDPGNDQNENLGAPVPENIYYKQIIIIIIPQIGSALFSPSS